MFAMIFYDNQDDVTDEIAITSFIEQKEYFQILVPNNSNKKLLTSIINL